MPRVEGNHRVGLEVELVGSADDPVFGGLRPREEVLTVLVRFFNGTGFGLGDVGNKFSWVVAHIVI